MTKIFKTNERKLMNRKLILMKINNFYIETSMNKNYNYKLVKCTTTYYIIFL